MTNGPLCSAEELERPIRSVMPMPGSRSEKAAFEAKTVK